MSRAAGSGTQRPLRLAEMTTEEAARAVTESPVVILPAGAFEQHGPGMPLATDTIRAEQVCRLVAAELAGRAVIGPSLPVGVSRTIWPSPARSP